MGSYAMPTHMYWDLVAFVIEHQLPIERLVNHGLPLEEAGAFRVVGTHRTGTVILEME